MSRKHNVPPNRKNRSELGATIVEAALILPVWLLLALAVMDIYFLLRTRSVLDHVAREAVLTSATLPVTGAKSPSFSNYFSDFQGCLKTASSGGGVSGDCASKIVAARARLILESLHKKAIVNSDEVAIDVAENGQEIQVSVRAPYRSYILKYLFGKLVTATASGPANIHRELNFI